MSDIMHFVSPKEWRSVTYPDGVVQDVFGAHTEKGPPPQGYLAMMAPQSRREPHFHRVNQFQVVVAGEGLIGKHPLHPGAVHYADAFTPYGPIVAGSAGLSFF